MSEEGRIVHHHHHQHQHGFSDQSPPPPPPPPPMVPQYGTFEGIPSSPVDFGRIVYHHHESGHHHHDDSDQFPPPGMVFPQPAPPPGAMGPPRYYYARGYQAVPGYVVAEGTPVLEPHLPCCGLGFGWFLFIIGFFLVGIPWYVGAIVLICRRHLDPREKPGYVGCTIAAVLAIIAIVFGASSIDDDW